MNSPNGAQLIHYVPKGQAVNNFLMAGEKCPKTPKNVGFDWPADMARPNQAGTLLGFFAF